jgi:hypothetical protein
MMGTAARAEAERRKERRVTAFEANRLEKVEGITGS